MLTLLGGIKWIILLGLLQRIAGLEVQWWMGARRQGMRGESAVAGAFVDMTGALTMTLYWVWLVVIGFRIGWVEAAVVFAFVGALRWCYSRLAGPNKVWRWLIGLGSYSWLDGPNQLWRWLIGLVAVWPLTIAMFLLVL